jgi:hypothetical protein
MEIWEAKPPGTLWATPGLLGTALALPFFTSQFDFLPISIIATVNCVGGSNF